MRNKAVALVVLLLLAPGCVAFDLSGAPTRSLGVGHIHERLPATAKVGTFRDSTPERSAPPALLARATDAFTVALRRSELFERVVRGGGDRAEVGLDAEIVSFSCTRNHAFIWAFYSVFALIAIPANLPLTIDECDYQVRLRAIEVATGRTLGTYEARFHARSWRGAWTLFATFLDEQEQVLDRVDHDLLRALVDDYPKLAAAGRDGPRPTRPAAGPEDPVAPR